LILLLRSFFDCSQYLNSDVIFCIVRFVIKKYKKDFWIPVKDFRHDFVVQNGTNYRLYPKTIQLPNMDNRIISEPKEITEFVQSPDFILYLKDLQFFDNLFCYFDCFQFLFDKHLNLQIRNSPQHFCFQFHFIKCFLDIVNPLTFHPFSKNDIFISSFLESLLYKCFPTLIEFKENPSCFNMKILYWSNFLPNLYSPCFLVKQIFEFHIIFLRFLILHKRELLLEDFLQTFSKFQDIYQYNFPTITPDHSDTYDLFLDFPHHDSLDFGLQYFQYRFQQFNLEDYSIYQHFILNPDEYSPK